MRRIKTITGTIIESSRFLNKPRYWHEQPVCNERRELWLATSHEDEYGFIIHTKLMPARKTHCVTLVLAGATVLGLYNATTGASANYIREDPPRLTRGVDVFVMLGLLLVGCIGTAMAYLNACQAMGGALAYLACAGLSRAVHRRRLRCFVDEALNELHVMRVVRPIRRAQVH